MGNLSGFDARQIEPMSFDVLPAGEYEVCIAQTQMKPTKDGHGQYLELELQVLDSPFQNRRLYDRLNLINASDQAVQIARGTLSSICRAVDVLTPDDSSQLHGKILRAKVVIAKSAEYGDSNEIKAYKPRGAGPSTGGQPLAAGSEQSPWSGSPVSAEQIGQRF
jgi:hypothetical protein